MERPSFTEAVRQELARTAIDGDRHAWAELAAIVRLTGMLTVKGGDRPELHVEVETTSGAVARRTFALLQHRYGHRPELVVRAASGVRRTTYGVRVADGAGALARDLEVVDAGGAPTDALPANVGGSLAAAYVRGALLASGSISSPGRQPHLEVAAGPGVAHGLARLIHELVGAPASVVEGERTRVVMKSGERIGELLAAVGATRAFLEWDDRRLRRQLRGEANRLANADGANLRRSIEASRGQVRDVEAAIAAVGWTELGEELRGVALARLANPEATLAELGELVDPPVGKSAVHRRLRRLEEIARDAHAPEDPQSDEAEGRTTPV